MPTCKVKKPSTLRLCVTTINLNSKVSICTLSLRSVPAAGVTIGLTQRCPMNCAHCSTNSTMASTEFPSEMFLRFVDTFEVDNHPEVIAISGGEALLRPKLVRSLAEIAREVGTRSTVLSGMFFARAGRIPLPIRKAINAVDHFSVSIDVYHERLVPRANVFFVLDALLSDGIDLSIHIAGQNATDPYLEDLINEVQSTFDNKIPMLVNSVSSFGRAKAWVTRGVQIVPENIDANPCAMAAWPVVGFDGTIIACGNDNVLENVPAHLLIGNANTDNWATIRDRCLSSSMLRAIRLFGPEYIADRFLDSGLGCDGYCQTCMKLQNDTSLQSIISDLTFKPSFAILEEQASAMQRSSGALSFARRHGIPRYAELVTLGAPS
ncbi:MAG: radical SAM protein [Methylobacter sp.]